MAPAKIWHDADLEPLANRHLDLFAILVAEAVDGDTVADRFTLEDL